MEYWNTGTKGTVRKMSPFRGLGPSGSINYNQDMFNLLALEQQTSNR